MPTADPAWFYAALAQTSAAVVGLFGAVLGSHILQHLGAMREERRDLLERVNSVYAHLKGRIEHWRSFKDYLERKMARENSILELGTPFLGTVEEVTWEGSGHPEIQTLEPRNDAEEDLKLLAHIVPAYHLLAGRVRRTEITAYASRLRKCASSLPSHTKAAHLVAHDAAALEKLFSRVSRFRSRLFPRSFMVVLFVLAWVSITGIVWPLSALPGFSTRPSQTIMLAALAAGLLILLGYFTYQFRILAKLGRIYWQKPH